MKKLLILIFILVLGQIPNNAFSKIVEARQDNSKVIVDKTARYEVKRFLHDMEKASNKHDIEALKAMYDEAYKSMDGFDYKTFFEMASNTFENYPDIKSKIKIRSVNVYGDFATAYIEDKTWASVGDIKNQKEEDIGLLDSFCEYVLYMKRANNSWVITRDEIISEETALKFGDTKKLDMRLSAPLYVNDGDDYVINFEVNLPKDIFALASLNNEPIVRPNPITKEAHRVISNDAPLERIVHVNKDGLNEYSVATIGLSKVVIDKGDKMTSVTFDMKGMAFIMKRVNVLKYAEVNKKNGKNVNAKKH